MDRMWGWADLTNRFSYQTALDRMLRIPLRLLPETATVRVLSGVNKGCKWIVGSSVHGCWLGHYESQKQVLVSHLIGPGMTVFDIGANVGLYTLAFARLVGLQGDVWAFEPDCRNVSYLLAHIDRNHLGKVKVVQAVVGGCPDVLPFQRGINSSVGKAGASSAYLVPQVTLDDLWKNGDVRTPDLMKIDVEGAEHDVLEGAQRILAERATRIVLSLHGDDPKRRCGELLRELGYVLYSLDGVPLAEIIEDEIYALPQ